MENNKYIVNILLKYAKAHLYLNEDDEIYMRNYLMNKLHITDYEEMVSDFNPYKFEVPDKIIDIVKNIVTAQGNDEKESEKIITEIMGTLTPLPSVVRETFFKKSETSKLEATQYFYDLMIKNNYVQKTKIEQSIVLKDQINNHDLEVTINLSKPEKSTRSIAQALKNNATNTNYPKCAICIENEGCSGSSKTGPRNNLRLIPLKLNNKTWYLQYSPYGYYNEHCILISEEHTPMFVGKENTKTLCQFVNFLPHYFIGNNADLPIVGGSILTHNHFQGGHYMLPMMKVNDRFVVETKNKNITLSVIDWPATSLKIVSKSEDEIVETVDKIFNYWNNYDSKEHNIISHTEETRHNTINTILRKADDNYVCYVMLRNNRTDEQHPDGIFHVAKERQIIKQENIGLIEAMGLFVLPARLKRQLSILEDILNNKISYEDALILDSDMKKYEHIYQDFLSKKYLSMKDMLFKVCENILNDIAVFKNDDKGQDGLKKFIKGLDL
ncbi:MAG: galactose-1-phosphate uridylyltransferase [Bacilli bacterium]